MQLVVSLLAVASVASAHYNFEALIYNGVTYPIYEHVRQRTNVWSHAPVENVALLDIRCGLGSPPAPSILTVAAGSTLGFTVASEIQHPGPSQAYMAKVPAGKTAANWDGSGSTWFKIYSQGPTFTNGQMTWPSLGNKSIQFKIPAATPPGDYLVRGEHIGLHGAQNTNGAQFYGSCGQITVTGSGKGKPGPLVAFPGAYSPNDPGIKLNIYWPVPTSYTPPGPPVWSG